MTKDLFSSREEEIFRTLQDLKGRDFVVIGGYAVNAYALPRFSVDCDIVAKDNNELDKIEKILLKRDYKKEKSAAAAQYMGGFLRYGKKLDNNFTVSIDIFIHDVADRMTGAKFSAEWIFKNSKVKLLKGKTITEELKLRIINIGALIAMKIISCRPTDIRDVFMMLPNADDKEWIKSEIALRCDLQDRMTRLIKKVNSKQFKDGLSGVYGYFDQKVFEKHKKATMHF